MSGMMNSIHWIMIIIVKGSKGYIAYESIAVICKNTKQITDRKSINLWYCILWTILIG